MQRLPSRYTPFKAEPAEFVHDQFIKDKSAANKIVRSGNKRGRGTKDQGRGKKLSKRMYNSKRDTGRRTVKVTENLSQKLKPHGRGTQGRGGGRGRRTVRKRRVEKRAVEDLLLGHAAASGSLNIGREPLRSLDEEWDGEKESPMTPVHIGVAENSNSAEEMESDDNAQAVEYDQGNWEVGYNGDSPNKWNRDFIGMSDEDVDASEDDFDNDIGNGNDIGIEENDFDNSIGIEENDFDNSNGIGIEENQEEDSDDVMSEGSDGMANRVVNAGGSDSAVSEDSSD